MRALLKVGRRVTRWALGPAVVALALANPGHSWGQARDSGLVWRTVRTEHFEIHYHEPLGVTARRVAAVAERAQAVLGPLLRHVPSERTHVVLSDVSDSANGSAGVIPYNAIRLFATAPEDLAPLHDYDDWLSVLFTHEHTHILHLDTIGGIPALINSIFGKVYPPNAVQPRWFLEGIAVVEESAHTAGGRLRASMWDMFLRMDALENRLLRLDQISNGVDRWPHGNVWYLYGSYFVRHIAERHGVEALARMSHDYGNQAIPYGLNRTARRATGQTFSELYDEFLNERRRHYEDVARSIRAQGEIAGTRLTHHGETARSPRFLDAERVVYWASDGESRSQLRVVDARSGNHPQELVRVSGTAAPAVHPNGRHVYYSSADAHRDIYFFQDLFRFDRETQQSTRLTNGLRAREPDIASDGRRIAFSINGAATSHLVIAELSDIERSKRVVVRSARHDQVYTPRWSPNGRSIAFSQWRQGGFRDIRLLDVASGDVVSITDDRALDTGPTWSPDGEYIFFSSDRTGIANIYAFELRSGRTLQVTNVVSGAYQPAISPRGDYLVYVGYTSRGFDLYGLELHPENFRDAPVYVDTRPDPSDAGATLPLRSERYSPLPTLLPRSYMLEYTEDGFGNALAVTFSGSDVVGYHAYAGSVGMGLSKGNINADLNYTYQHSPLPLNLRAFRTIAPRGGLFVGGRRERWIEEAVGGEINLSYSIPRAFHSERLRLGYSLTHIGKWRDFGGNLDPNDPPPSLPETGVLAQVGASWSWSNIARTTQDVTPSEGRSLQFSVGLADPLLGSQFSAVTSRWGFTQFLENPMIEHHVLAMRYAGGLSGGDLGRRGLFSLGGFPSVSLLDALRDDIVLGGAALRGYPSFDRSGTQFHQFQLEYRFPLMRPMASVGLLPAFLRRVWALVFFDYGDAFFGKLDIDTFRVGVGGELLTEFTLGYQLHYTLRIGIGRGLSEGGETQPYAHLGIPF